MRGIFKLFSVVPLLIILCCYGYWNLCNLLEVDLGTLIFNRLYAVLFIVVTVFAAILFKRRNEYSWGKSIILAITYSIFFIGFMGIGKGLVLILVLALVLMVIYINRTDIKRVLKKVTKKG